MTKKKKSKQDRSKQKKEKTKMRKLILLKWVRRKKLSKLRHKIAELRVNGLLRPRHSSTKLMPIQTSNIMKL